MASTARISPCIPDMAMTILVTFWGTRGTIPVPGLGTARYGGNTPCVSITDEAGHRVILDAGTGIRRLGNDLSAQTQRGRLDLFLSHVHWDHIQGLPFFAPMYADGQEIHIHGPTPVDSDLEAVLDRQLDPAVYPVPRTARPAQVVVQELRSGDVTRVPGFEVRSFGLSHPGGALGYRITPDGGGPTVAYLTDNELGSGGAARVAPDWRESLVQFVRDSTLLIHDAMYTPALVTERSGWGHSSALDAVTLAADAGVKQLALFHHDPEHDDGHVDGLLAMARAAAPDGVTVNAAHEGWTVTL
ncbi:MAG: MBL fold metallo-hydrolase [Gemmatimonadales bacterium]|nr:MAG: MBL fold metallo-hydrolase [Gemmatimonadales bacterium]